MKRIFALTVAGAALFAAASIANAQEDCVGGYRMIKDQVPVTCSGGGSTMFERGAATTPEEPLYTGSIQASATTEAGGNSEQIPTTGNQMVFADSRDSCKPGEYYMQDMQSMNFPVRCR
jgi:hypothetical protein